VNALARPARARPVLSVGTASLVGPAPASARARSLANPAALHSALYEGWIHCRSPAPKERRFRHRICLLWLDLAEIDRVLGARRLWSVNRRNLGEFRRGDYLGDPARPLDAAVRDLVERECGRRPAGPIRLLALARTYGHGFHPASFCYCYDAAGRVPEFIVADLADLPRGGRRAWILDAADAARDGDTMVWLTVTPGEAPCGPAGGRECRWRFTVPGEELRIEASLLRIAASPAAAAAFEARLAMRRRPLDGVALARVLWRYPALSLRLHAAIAWQCLRRVRRND
jgi:DUF1365 family protein